MAFKPVIANTQRHPFITISTAAKYTRELSLSSAAHRAIGEPRAISFEWDDDDALLRISAASPDSPESSPLAQGLRSRCTVTTLLASLGVQVSDTTRFPVKQDGPLAIIADLSEYRSR